MIEALRRLWGSRPGSGMREETWEVPGGPAGRGLRLPVHVAVHPFEAPRVVVMLSGWDGSLDGYARKYVALAEHARSRCAAAVVRSGNHVVRDLDFEVTCIARLRSLLDGVAARARRLCGHPEPELHLFGVSAGASAMAAVAAEVPAVRKLLLVAPSSDAGYDAVVGGLRRFTGELYVVVGAADEVVGDLPQSLFEEAVRAARRELAVVPACDHQFRGARNGRILSQAPLWAFAGDRPFPDPARGIHLYD